MANKTAIRRLEKRFQEAETEGSCLVPASRADAAALRRLSAKHEVVEPVDGAFARSAHWRALKPDARARHLVRALAKRHPTWVFSHGVAALLHGIEVPYAELRCISAYGSPSRRLNKKGRLVIRAMPPGVAEGAKLIDGVRVTSMERAIADCLRTFSFGHGLIVADSAMRLTGMPRRILFELLEKEAAGREGARRARIIAQHADGRAESGAESLGRAVMISHGFMVPELQVEFPDILNPGRTFRTDHFWRLGPREGLIGECDGIEKYGSDQMLNGATTVQSLARERQRESRLTLLGYPVLRYGYHDARHPHRLVKMLRAAGVPEDADAAERWRRAWKAAQPRTSGRRASD